MQISHSMSSCNVNEKGLRYCTALFKYNFLFAMVHLMKKNLISVHYIINDWEFDA